MHTDHCVCQVRDPDYISDSLSSCPVGGHFMRGGCRYADRNGLYRSPLDPNSAPLIGHPDNARASETSALRQMGLTKPAGTQSVPHTLDRVACFRYATQEAAAAQRRRSAVVAPATSRWESIQRQPLTLAARHVRLSTSRFSVSQDADHFLALDPKKKTTTEADEVKVSFQCTRKKFATD